MRTRHGEFEFIAAIQRRARARRSGPDLLHGIGDDAAVLQQHTGRNTVITTDLLVEDVDFRRATTPPRAVGHKALAVSVSDLAAMGAQPRWALLAVGVPAAVWRTRWLDEFYAGFFTLAARTGVTLIGGDVSRTPERIVVDAIVLGDVRRGRAVLRSGARPGDQLFVTGTLGGAAAGLHILEASKRARPRATAGHTWPAARARGQLVARQQQPTPRLAWGAWLGARQLASAMIDLSDGLSSDLAHLCRASGVGAQISAAHLPVDPHIAQAGLADPAAALAFALHGGEDFELLFTVHPAHVRRLPAALDGVPITHIGEIRPRGSGLNIVGPKRTRKLTAAGFAHFAPE